MVDSYWLIVAHRSFYGALIMAHMGLIVAYRG